MLPHFRPHISVEIVKTIKLEVPEVTILMKTFIDESTYTLPKSAYSNIPLVGGFGFGSADDMWSYLIGEWSERFGVQPMPFDGFLVAG